MGIAPSAAGGGGAVAPAAGAIGGGPGVGAGAGPLSSQQQQGAAQEQAQGIVDRFDQAYLKDRILFGGIVSGNNTDADYLAGDG